MNKAVGRQTRQLWDGGAPGTWIGKTVLIQRPDVKIGHTDDAGNQVYLATLDRPDYVVMNERDGWIQVRQGEHEGWFDKADAVTFENSLRHFSQTIQQRGGDAWTLACRARVYELRGELAPALRDLDRAAQLDATNWTAARDRVRLALQN